MSESRFGENQGTSRESGVSAELRTSDQSQNSVTDADAGKPGPFVEEEGPVRLLARKRPLHHLTAEELADDDEKKAEMKRAGSVRTGRTTCN